MKKYNTYTELNHKGELVDKQAESRNVNTMHTPLEDMPGYKRISDHLIELEINGVIKRYSLFRIVPEGNNKEKLKKRVQMKKKDIFELPDGIVTVYINDGCVIYGYSKNINSLLDLPKKNPTTLYRVSITLLKNTFARRLISTELISRHNPTTVLFSRDLLALLKEEESPEDVDKDFVFGDEEFEIMDGESNLVADIEVGKWSEMKVFELLKSDKDLREWIEIKSGVKIEEVDWINENGEMHKPFDIEINGKIKIEVKGSKDEGQFMMSGNEWDTLESSTDGEYFLIKINGVDIDKSSFSEIKKYTTNRIKNMKKQAITYIITEGDKDE